MSEPHNHVSAATEHGYLEDNIATLAYHLGQSGASITVSYSGSDKLLVGPGATLQEASRRLAPAQPSGLRECLQSIADADDSEPREPDDADWRFRFLEAQRAARCALAAHNGSSADSGHTEASGYAASLRQMAAWHDAGEDDIDVDELRAAADYIERTAVPQEVPDKEELAAVIRAGISLGKPAFAIAGDVLSALAVSRPLSP